MNRKLFSIFIGIILFLTEIAYAYDVDVYRECPTEVKAGAIIQINITVENKVPFGKNITIKELFGDFEAIEPKPIIPTPEETGIIALPPPYYRWEFNLPQFSKNTVYYKIRIPYTGYITLSPTIVYANGEILSTETCTFQVVCNNNNKCEQELGENNINCPQDCPSVTTTIPVGKPSRSIYVYIIIIGIIIAVIAFFLYKIRVVA